ncbi:MAG: hypothetical protein ACRCZI_10420 [Cetobacterium sp.]
MKAAGNDNLNLASVIGKNTAGEFWWAIRSISGTTITLDNSPTGAPASTPKGYVGTTETITTYKRDLVSINTNTGAGSVTDSGTAGNLITFSGGWNRTDMSTQTDITMVDAGGTTGTAFNLGGRSFVHLDKLYAVRATSSFNSTLADCSFGEVGSIACTIRVLDVALSAPRLRISSISVIQGTGDLISFAHGLVCDSLIAYGVEANIVLRVNSRSAKLGTVRIKNASLTMFSLAETYGDNISIDLLDLDGATNGLAQTALLQNVRIKSITASNITGTAVALRGGNVLRIDSLTLTNNAIGLSFDTAAVASKTIIGSITTSGNTTPFRSLATGLLGDIYVNKSSFAEGSPISFSGSDYSTGRLVFQNYNGTAGDHRTYYGSFNTGATVFADSTTRHSASGLAWKFTIQSSTNISADFPVVFPVARVAVNANALTTVTLWTRRAATTVAGAFRCRGGQIAGVANDLTASSSALANTWEALTVTFTPTEAGVIDFDFLMSGATATDLFIHDFSATQA